MWEGEERGLSKYARGTKFAEDGDYEVVRQRLEKFVISAGGFLRRFLLPFPAVNNGVSGGDMHMHMHVHVQILVFFLGNPRIGTHP